MTTQLRCLFKLSAGIAILLILSACTSSNIINIEGRDNDVLYGLQTSFPVSEGENPVYFKLQSLKTSADFSHRIPDGKFIDFENIQLSGPDSVSVESDIRTTAASFGTFELMTMNDFSSSFFIGFSHTELDAEIAFLSGSAVNKRDQINELYFDVGFWYQAIEELKLGFVMAFGINGNISTYSDIQLSLNYKLLPHMELVAGFRDFYYYYGEGDSTSNLIIDSRGPFMVLNFPF